jgi:hypothetical protein
MDARTLLGYDVYQNEVIWSPPLAVENKELLSFLNGESLRKIKGYFASEPAMRFFRSPGLPPSLEYLTIKNCHNLILASMIDLLVAAREKPLKLKTVKVSALSYKESLPGTSPLLLRFLLVIQLH